MTVLLTVDTEIWPFRRTWPQRALPLDADLAREWDVYVDGKTDQGFWGIDYQMEVLNAHGLNATFLLESLHCNSIGSSALKAWARKVRLGGQDVQLHAHPEWLPAYYNQFVDGSPQQFLYAFPELIQTRIIKQACVNLIDAGGPIPTAFRAGNYGADSITLKALAANDIHIDSSFNRCFPVGEMHTDAAAQGAHPLMLSNVAEYPVSFFQDYPGHFRHAQLGACSFAEMGSALVHAYQSNWSTFVIVWHNFELLRIERSTGRATPYAHNVRRLDNLCKFLGQTKEFFATRFLSELVQDRPTAQAPADPFRSPLTFTAKRHLEQLVARLQ